MDPLTVSPRPLKRHAALVSYSRDHHFGLLLVWKLRKGCNKGIEKRRMLAYLNQSWCAELLPHFRDEEQWLLAHLPKKDQFSQRTFHEHANIESLVKKLNVEEATPEAFLQFAEALESHIRFEERELFAHLQEVLPAEVLQQLEETERSPREDVDSQWQDHFWLSQTEED